MEISYFPSAKRQHPLCCSTEPNIWKNWLTLDFSSFSDSEFIFVKATRTNLDIDDKSPGSPIALMLVLTFSVRLGWLPALGMGTFENGLGDVIRHMVLPCFCLSTIPMATFARITRSSILESISSDSIRAIRARGIRDAIVIWKYALKSALPPIVTVLGLQLASCFAGAILTENVFSWPGMGSLMVGAIDNRDYMLIQGAVLVIALAFVLVNLAVDIVYMLINPRVSYEGGS